MKAARLVALLGSVATFLTGCLHSFGFADILARVQRESLAAETSAILKTCWLTFSVELIVLGILAFFARSMQRGGVIVFLCGLAVAACGGLMLYFLGPFIGVYMMSVDAVLLLFGGYLLWKASASS
jgi:hypothetical protein